MTVVIDCGQFHYTRTGRTLQDVSFQFDLCEPLEEIERLLPAHIRFLDACYEQGKFLCSGRKEPRTGGVILCICGSREEAESIRDQDPFFREGAAEYEVIEFLPSKMSQSFRALLG